MRIGKQKLSQTNEESNKEQPQPLETSALFEPNAIWILLLFLLGSVWYKFTPLIIISIFLILLFIITIAWKEMSLKHIESSLELSKSRLFSDEDFLIKASVKNKKLLPLIWLEWSFPKNDGLQLGDNEGDSNTVRFLWLLWFQQVKWSINGKALKRGVYNIGQITLRSGDGFRFTEKEQLHSLDEKLYVYPKLISVNVPNFSSLIQGGTKGRQSGFIEDPLLHIGIREYQAGDEFRRFNWKASSRTGKLQVNVYQPVVMEQVIFYIDVQGFVINENVYDNPLEQKEYVSKIQETFEWVLSIIASAAVKYNEQGFRVGFTSNGLTYSERKMPGIPPSGDLTPVLDQLAEITQRVGVKKMEAMDEMLYKRSRNNSLYIFCNRITKDHYRWYQEHKNKLSEVRFYYLNETEYAKQIMTIAKPMDTNL